MLGVLLPSSRRVDGVAAFTRERPRVQCRRRVDGVLFARVVAMTRIRMSGGTATITQTRHHQNNAIRTGKEVVRTRMEQLQALEDAQDAAASAKKPVPEQVIKKEEEDEGPRRIKARDRDQRCAACRCEARGVFAASFPAVTPSPRRAQHTGMEPTYAHTCVKGIKLAAGELSDSTEEEEVEAMEMYARLAEAEDPRDFEQTLQEARKRALAEENEIQQSIETLEELAREHVNDSLTVMEYRYELRQMSRFGFLSGLISAPRAHVERNVAKAVLQGSPKNLRTALMVLSTFPPVRYAVSPYAVAV